MLKVNLLLQARERVTGPLRQIRAGVRTLVRDGEGQLSRLGRALRRVGIEGRLAGRDLAAGLRRGATLGFTALQSITRRAMSGISSVIRRSLQIGAVGVTAGVGYLLWQLTGGVIEVTSQFEQFQVVLENTEGSAAGARRAMAWVRNFAQTTPYEVGDVMEAFVRLRAYGIDPTQGAMRSLGNAASGMNKSIMDAVEMLADAQTGEFERLKEFGIRARVTGDQVRFTYMRNGREMTRNARNSAAEIQRAITGIFDERFNGMMDRQSRTLAGLWSNLKDQWTSFQLAVGQAGIFDLVKGKIQQLLDRVNAMARNGQLQAWAQSTSRFLEGAFTSVWNFFTQTDWTAVAGHLRVVGDAIYHIAHALLKVKELAEAGVLGGASGGSMAGVGSRLIRQRQEAQAAGNAAATRDAHARGQRGAPGLLQTMDTRSRPQPRINPFSPYLSFPGNRAPQGARPLGAPLRQQAPARPQEVRVRSEVGGRIRIEMAESPMLSARLTRLESANQNVPINFVRGVAGFGM